MGGGKSSAPKAPDMSKLADASIESANLWRDVSMEQLAWAKETDAANRTLLEKVLGVQLPQMEMAFQNAQKDRLRYEDVFQPVENNLIADLQKTGSLERQEAEAARRVADVRSQYEAQRANATRALEDYGIDPSQTRHQALDLGFRAQEAATAALAANQGRQYEEQMGRALRSEAINIGRGLPGQVAQAQGIVNQTAGGAVGNSNQTANTGAGLYGSALGAGQLSQSGYGQAANITNQGFQNQMTSYNANAAANQAMWSGIGGMAGMAMGGGFGSAMGAKVFGTAAGAGEEGGHVPYDTAGKAPGPTDQFPTMLAKDEYVIPADVVRAKGTEFFDKLVERYKGGNGQRKAIAV